MALTPSARGTKTPLRGEPDRVSCNGSSTSLDGGQDARGPTTVRPTTARSVAVLCTRYDFQDNRATPALRYLGAGSARLPGCLYVMGQEGKTCRRIAGILPACPQDATHGYEQRSCLKRSHLLRSTEHRGPGGGGPADHLRAGRPRSSQHPISRWLVHPSTHSLALE
jgi:hypothetical protein